MKRQIRIEDYKDKQDKMIDLGHEMVKIVMFWHAPTQEPISQSGSS